ncbi:3-deoxy-manno-octulosonate cytidylyltransferase [Pseudoalteromonas sp. H71]|uniref:3-deoxy-manno-octulosonate cytidylyltransferase n=1 Tax=Pseudoalteromonas sp. H71 TaxID=1348395 RepID=UPI00072FDF93|nr:3-deoxy-manno-octulosonate cytidylyltransferase [Pseudoalteromonas sp. H71]KTD88866.1 3-deoxy-manno-octulosonate cytidylyltransferase [Pseudoalteromonas sp. H71]
MIKVVIPARYGSSRLPGKPLLELKGKPLFWHVVQRVLESGVCLDDIIIATDDDRIFEVAKQLSLPVLMTSNQHESGTDRVNEVAKHFGWESDTIVVNVQGDEPLIPPSAIVSVIEFAVKNKNYEITTAVSSIESTIDLNNPNIVKAIIAENGRALYFTRCAAPFNRDEPHTIYNCFRHIGIYTYRCDVLNKLCLLAPAQLEKIEKLEQLRALSHGYSIGATVLSSAPPHGIDTVEDYKDLLKLMEDEDGLKKYC